jgi:hypothetical protein
MMYGLISYVNPAPGNLSKFKIPYQILQIAIFGQFLPPKQLFINGPDALKIKCARLLGCKIGKLFNLRASESKVDRIHLTCLSAIQQMDGQTAPIPCMWRWEYRLDI